MNLKKLINKLFNKCTSIVTNEQYLFHICRITNRVKSLLNLIPTDPAVSDALDHVGQRVGLMALNLYIQNGF